MAEKRGKKGPESLTELAVALGVSRKSVNTAIETGKISPACYADGPHGRVLVDGTRAMREYKQAQEIRPAQAPRAPSGSAPAIIQLPENFDVEDPSTWPLDLDGLKMVREWWIARQAKRKDDLAAGELVRSEDMRREIFGASRVVRDQLLKIPDNLGADLAAETEIEGVRKILRTAIERALSDLAQMLSGIAAQRVEAEAEDAEST